MTEKPPAVVLFYAFSGLIPFLLPPLLSWLLPEHRPLLAQALLWWGAIILSFLGGARWGVAVQAPVPDSGLIGLTMLPSIFAWATLLMPVPYYLHIWLLVAGFNFMLIWDRSAGGLPGWYGWLRQWLTTLASAGLLAQLLF